MEDQVCRKTDRHTHTHTRPRRAFTSRT